MEKSKYDLLKDAIHDYGAAAFENLLRCKGLAQSIVDQFNDYIDCPPEMVRAVPAQGEFDPKKNYGDEAFSFSQRPVIVLEPVHFGLTLIVGNAEDSGLLWLRTHISIEVTGDTFDVFVASQPVIRVPLHYDDHLAPIFEAIYREFIRTFEMEVMEFNDARFKNGIGFVR